MWLYPEFRSALEIKEIEDPAAKELFIAMEECFVHDESGIDSLLERIKERALRNFIANRGSSPEFKGGTAGDPKRLMEDGIKGIRKKRLRKRLTEIGAELRTAERAGGNVNIEELLAEKMFIDSQIRKL
jgi:DNA primase